jgi:pimeloyl-ACP methyl ester carboxylesterase
MRTPRLSALALASSVLLFSCSSTPDEPDLETLYERAAHFEDATRNPIVVIPGVLGSRLVDDETGRLVWGAFDGNFADPETAAGARLVSLPMRLGAPLDELVDQVRSDGALESLEVSVLGLPFQLEAYRSILRTLGAGGYLDESLVTGLPSGVAPLSPGSNGALDWGDEHFTCFQFDYDWRRGIPENAQRLAIFLEARASDVRTERAKRFGEEAGREPVHFDLVAHSLGGLVARWYLRYGGDMGGSEVPALTWVGAKRIERCILVGTPNLGSSEALSELVHGMDLGSFAADYPAAVLGTLPSTYQLLPHRLGDLVNSTQPDAEPAPDIFDATLWRNLGWGLADPTADPVLAWLLPDVADPLERQTIALEHQEKCLAEARRVAMALDTPAARPASLDLALFCGDALDTPATSQFLLPTGELWTRTTAAGDGTVSRKSALGDLRTEATWTATLVGAIDWSSVTFLFRDHLGLVDDPSFVDNLLYLLLEEPR